MADSKQQNGSAQTGLVIPDDVKSKYPDLINLIIGSESMNNEERQYWINILPIMTPEQVENLRGILVNEKRQLAAIDKKYAKEIEQIGQSKLLKQTEEERRRKREERLEKERKAALEEEDKTQDILNQINGV